MGIVETERAQPADKEHWWPNFQLAQKQDLQRRLAREHAAADQTH